jgi:hypothetical protein
VGAASTRTPTAPLPTDECEGRGAGLTTKQRSGVAPCGTLLKEQGRIHPALRARGAAARRGAPCVIAVATAVVLRAGGPCAVGSAVVLRAGGLFAAAAAGPAVLVARRGRRALGRPRAAAAAPRAPRALRAAAVGHGRRGRLRCMLAAAAARRWLGAADLCASLCLRPRAVQRRPILGAAAPPARAGLAVGVPLGGAPALAAARAGPGLPLCSAPPPPRRRLPRAAGRRSLLALALGRAAPLLLRRRRQRGRPRRRRRGR